MGKNNSKKEEKPMIRVGVPTLNMGKFGWVVPEEDEYANFEQILEIIPYGNSGIWLLKTFDGKFEVYRLVITDVKHNIHITNMMKKPTMFLTTKYGFTKEELLNYISFADFAQLLELDEIWSSKPITEVSFYDRTVSCNDMKEIGVTAVSDKYFYGLLSVRLGGSPTVSFEDYMKWFLNKDPYIKTSPHIKELFKAHDKSYDDLFSQL